MSSAIAAVGLKVSLAPLPEGSYLELHCVVQAPGSRPEGGCCLRYYETGQLPQSESEVALYRSPCLPVQFWIYQLIRYLSQSECSRNHHGLWLVFCGHFRQSSSRDPLLPWLLGSSGSPVPSIGYRRYSCINFPMDFSVLGGSIIVNFCRPIHFSASGCTGLSFSAAPIIQARNIRIGRSGAEADHGLQSFSLRDYPSLYGSSLSVLPIASVNLFQGHCHIFFWPDRCNDPFSSLPSWSLTCISVAQGCSPAIKRDDPRIVPSLVEGACRILQVFFVHLFFLLLCVQTRLLIRSARADKTPFGSLVQFPSQGTPDSIVLALAFTAPSQPAWPSSDIRNSRGVANERSRTNRAKDKSKTRKAKHFAQGSCGLCRWCQCALGLFFAPTLPLQVWAMPQPWGEAVEIILAATRLFPEPLPLPVSSGDRTLDNCGSTSQTDRVVSFGLLAHSERDAATLLPVYEADDIPVPPPAERETATTEGHIVQAYCFVMAPSYHAEILSLPLHLPITVDGICAEVKAALRTLELRFAFQVVPTLPQIGVDFASFVAIPTWVQAAGKQVVVFDFHDVGGPVYASIVHSRMNHWDCEVEARRHGIRNWCVYAQLQYSRSRTKKELFQ